MTERAALDGPLISVVIPVHNGEGLVERAVESALAQTYRRLEVIVVDDGSTDSTSAVVRHLAVQEERLRLLRLDVASGTPARPRNCAIESSAGDLIALLDHDDTWVPDKLEVQVERLAATGADICYSRCLIDDVSTRSALDYHRQWTPQVGPLPEGDLWTTLLDADVVPCSTALFKRSLYDQIGGFADDLQGIEDYDFWLRASVAGATFCAVEAQTMRYRWSPDSLSHRDPLKRSESFLSMWSRLYEVAPADPRLAASLRRARSAHAQALLRSAAREARRGERRALVLRALALRPPPSVVLPGLVRVLGKAIRRRRDRTGPR